MNLETTLSLLAGGPGSGRHPEHEKVLKQYSWSRQPKGTSLDEAVSTDKKDVYTHKDLPGHSISVYQNGSWSHYENDRGRGRGYGNDANSLADFVVGRKFFGLPKEGK